MKTDSLMRLVLSLCSYASAQQVIFRYEDIVNAEPRELEERHHLPCNAYPPGACVGELRVCHPGNRCEPIRSRKRPYDICVSDPDGPTCFEKSRSCYTSDRMSCADMKAEPCIVDSDCCWDTELNMEMKCLAHSRGEDTGFCTLDPCAEASAFKDNFSAMALSASTLASSTEVYAGDFYDCCVECFSGGGCLGWFQAKSSCMIYRNFESTPQQVGVAPFCPVGTPQSIDFVMDEIPEGVVAENTWLNPPPSLFGQGPCFGDPILSYITPSVQGRKGRKVKFKLDEDS